MTNTYLTDKELISKVNGSFIAFILSSTYTENQNKNKNKKNKIKIKIKNKNK